MNHQHSQRIVTFCFAVSVGLIHLSNALTPDEAKTVSAIHNRLRSAVQPSAANMQRITYSEELEKRAEDWACLNFNGIHPDSKDYRDVVFGLSYDYGNAYGPKEAMINMLAAMEKSGATYDYRSNTCDIDCPLYKQMISAQIRSVGCALHIYSGSGGLNSYRLACLYTPVYVSKPLEITAYANVPI